MSFEKPDGTKEVPLEKKDTPDQKQEKDDAQKRQETDTTAQKYYNDAKPGEVMPGGTIYSREAQKLVDVGQECAEKSLSEMTSSKNWNNISLEAITEISKDYENLTQWLEDQVEAIKQKYAGKSDPKGFQKELFAVQKQFETNIGNVAAKANGIVNGSFANKKVLDESHQEEQNIRNKETGRFYEMMQDMLNREALLKSIDQWNITKNQQKSEHTQGVMEANARVDDFYGLERESVAVNK